MDPGDVGPSPGADPSLNDQMFTAQGRAHGHGNGR